MIPVTMSDEAKHYKLKWQLWTVLALQRQVLHSSTEQSILKFIATPH